ncbi:27445_t:CDS:2 [Dentiscutata erythropus]|uniref:27445_t:CDS:1 n=1 Tax=Dentiscutata erythropus TaxID=1348616 RepID=A0A9N9BQL1_9GLOM|nr:27445_t:CDS:2 [Dentiscutata erythropus]
MKGNSKELALYYKELLQNGYNSDVIIRFGQEESLEKLYAHSLILRARSTFFDTALSSRWAKKEGNSFIIEMKDVPINIFKAVLSYIYTTEVSLNELDGIKFLEFLVEINKLLLSEEIVSKLFSSVQGRFEKLIRSDAIKVLQIVFQNNIFESLQKEFKQHRKFFENILSKDLFNNILNYHLDPNSLPTKARVLPSKKLFSLFFKRFEDDQQIEWTLELLSSSANFADNVLRKLNGAEVLKLIMKTNEFKIQNGMNYILSKNDNAKVILGKLDSVEILEIIEKSEELQIQGAVTKILSNKRISNIILRKFNENDVLKLMRIPNNMKYRKAVDDLLTSDEFIKIILDKLNIELLLQFMKTAVELPTKIIIYKLFTNVNLKLNLMVSLYVEQYLESLIQNDAVGVLQMVFNHDICEIFRDYSIYLICVYPGALFDNPKLIQLDRSILILILQRDDMGKLEEKSICDYLIKWGTAQNKAIIRKNIKTWTSQDYKIFEKSIHEFIPLIRWFKISSKDFKQNQSLFENVIPDNLYQNIVDYHLDPTSSPKGKEVLPPRYLPDIFLLKPRHFKIFESWIEEVDQNDGRKNKNLFNKLQNDFNTSKLARVKKNSLASEYYSDYGPCFGCNKNDFDMYINLDELHISSSNIYPNLKSFIKLKTTLEIEDYEVWNLW